ncbi:adenosylcobinamide-phosphate synthase CbiB [Flexibacterium corallicola]|uniref:adenosylcobinamide-phosphate synthase CbiB n=1 Tax=Flexibacterium corallicola TaxID=3037259 RepID=UPI00286EB6AA|nr:adenosylcobinamide-phosphate synthase CbiB [Pseudovibrio sp. M1P-2-3]
MLAFEYTPLIVLAAIILDALFGEPEWLWRRLPHPIVLIGNLIGTADLRLNKDGLSPACKKLTGLCFIISLTAAALVLGIFLETLLRLLPFGEAGIAVIGAVFLAQKSLYQHVKAVETGLRRGLEQGRYAVSMIVGRDPKTLDQAGVSRAAIESCSENFSDGITAPLFWFLLLGLPGLLAYKAINTADSMIGHKTERHTDFGWAAARLDDLVNLPASRLSGVFISLSAPIVGGSVSRAFRTIFKYARQHRSPNAGWPEAAMAGALNVALAGPRVYTGYKVDDPYMNPEGRIQLDTCDISRALQVMVSACSLQALAVAVVAFAA